MPHTVQQDTAKTSAMCHTILIFLAIVLVRISNTSGSSCPQEFVCPCDELEDSKYGTILHVKCKRQNLTSIPNLTSLRNLNIHKLDLSDNPIAELHDYAFSGLRFVKWYDYSLPELLLDRLPLRSIFHNAFDGLLAEGLRLQLIDSQITEAPIDQLKKIPNITKLYLEHNKIGSIPDKAFASFKKLSYLDLSGNRLSPDLSPRIFSGLENCLETLGLKKVGIELFPTEALKGLKVLKKVDLSDNGILFLPAHLFQGFKTRDRLFSLQLSGNKLKSISPPTFSNVDVALRVANLELQYNYIKHVHFLNDPCSSVIEPNQNNIAMDGNPLVCDCDFYSVVNTGIYTLSGTCSKPEAYAGQEVIVWDAVVNGNARYQTAYGDMAHKDCAANVTKWDLKCGKWANYNINAAPLAAHKYTPQWFTFAFIITVRCF